PRVDFPTIAVSATLPGASPETMASAVATPLERRFGRIAGLTEMTSTSTLGTTSITLQFDLNRDIEAAARDVQAAINASEADLPKNLVTLPSYRKVNPADSSILILSLTSQTLPIGQIYDQANTVFVQKISQIAGVGQVFVGGGQPPAVRIQVDPQALADMGLGMEDLRSIVSRATVDEPKGGLSGPMRASALAVNDQLLDAAVFRKLVVGTQGGSVVHLGDVARVIDDIEDYRVAAWGDHDRGIVVLIRRQPGANILEVIDRIKALLPSMRQSISPAIDVRIALDRSTTIRASVNDVQTALLVSVLLVVLVVFLFLRSVRSTLIPSVAVPLSLLGTFALMYLCGYSRDNVSLMALTISTGFVVDDAIVVTENVVRFMEGGMPAFEAALQGAKQVGFTIVSITVSLLAVFIPILLMGGVVGRLFREFAITLSMAIAVSAVVSLTLTPMMCSRLLRAEGGHGRAYQLAERVFERLVRVYEGGLDWVLEHEALALTVTLLVTAVTVWLFVRIPKGLFPQQDTGQIAGFSDAPQNISFRAMRDRQEAINRVITADPAVAHMISLIGAWGASTINTGQMFFQLKPKAERGVSADQVIARLRPKLAKIEGITLFLQSVQDFRVGGRMARTQYQYTLEDGNLDELNHWAPILAAKLKTLPQLKDVATDQQTAGLEMKLDVDRDTAARLGVSMQAVDDALYDDFGQRQVATNYTEANQYHVVLEVKPELQSNPDSLQKVYVESAGGGQVPLGALARAQAEPTPLSINHQGQFPAVTISFNLAPGVALGQAVDAIHQTEEEIRLPPGVTASFQGTAQAFQASLATEPWLILAALLAVYIVLGVLYESLIHPITILSTLPPAGLGALIALRVFHTELSVIALIGVVLLIGIVKKNAILMIDFALEAQRDQGLAPLPAIRQACLLRFRPILMTTLAALFGALPLALGRGVGSELRVPLGITIVGGLIFSQILTLFTTPVIYLALDRLSLARPRGESAGSRPEAPPPPEESSSGAIAVQ
ncbi:MAG TPA: efflux RND transporter permease subunit, partial [Myxococcales bacterium]|nr:efflux RND transporter permease subunit [Myxococcales bacterium]